LPQTILTPKNENKKGESVFHKVLSYEAKINFLEVCRIKQMNLKGSLKPITEATQNIKQLVYK
jgi:hypothetical protein